MTNIEIYGHIVDNDNVLPKRMVDKEHEDGTFTVYLGGVETEEDIEWRAKGIYRFAEYKGFEITAVTAVQSD